MAQSQLARAIVTGASSGIGAVYADRLARRGHPLLLIARRADRLDQLAAELKSAHGVQVETLTADLADEADLARVEAALAQKPYSVLVNNAGAGALGPVTKVSAASLDQLVRLNIVALTRLSHAALNNFVVRGSGDLINISSVMAFAPSPSGAAYSGSKAYVLNFTRSLAQEVAGSGVRVQAVMPGPIRTEFFSAQGLSDTVFPDSMFLTAEQLVDAALAGLEAGEAVTIPSLLNLETWQAMEAARGAFMGQVGSGQVADRYQAAV
jgi:short-subunit dehydrogenase